VTRIGNQIIPDREIDLRACQDMMSDAENWNRAEEPLRFRLTGY